MNKNSRILARIKRIARRQGKREVTVNVPVYNYHSTHNLTAKTFAVSGGGGVVSRNEKRNMQMRVLTNSGGGNNASLTSHEKIHRDAPASPKPRMDNGEKNKRHGIKMD